MRGSNLDLKPQILERVGTSHPRTWSASDFADLGPRPAIDMALSRLVASGDLRRVRRGLYDKPRPNPLTGRESVPDAEATIEAITRSRGVRYVVDGLTAANDLGFTDAVPATTVVHVDARLKPVTLGNLKITFKRSPAATLVWAGRPAMRLVQALHWLEDTIPRDSERIQSRIRRLLDDARHGEAIRNDLKQGFGLLPPWMQELLREPVFGAELANKGREDTTS